MLTTCKQKGIVVFVIVALLLAIDQIIKIEVKTNMRLHESIQITNWFYISFIENNGMAYGMTLINKLVLSIFRICAIGVLIFYLYKQIVNNARIILLALVTAGALGNLIDCMFYGLIFNASSPFYTSYFVNFGDGYAPFLMGKVVDMFYFPLFGWDWPGWLPVCGGEHFVFFSPIFNFADASISCGVIALLLFCRDGLAEVLGGGSD